MSDDLLEGAQAIVDFAQAKNLSGGVRAQQSASSPPAEGAGVPFDSVVPAVSGSTPSAQNTSEIATEGGHWYLADGSPFYTITGKNGKERPVTIRDARKVGAVPSVTTITKILAKDGLDKWKQRQLFEAILDMEWGYEDDRDAVFRRAAELSQRKGRLAAERGDKLHGAVERFLQGKPVAPEWLPHVTKVTDTLRQYGIDIHDGAPEKSFAHASGFGGKVDWHSGVEWSEACAHVTSPGLILDFKSKDEIIEGKQLAYDEHAIQIAAYREGLGIPSARGINVFVGVNDCEVRIHEHSEQDLQRGWEVFQHLLAAWQGLKKYKPEINNNGKAQ